MSEWDEWDDDDDDDEWDRAHDPRYLQRERPNRIPMLLWLMVLLLTAAIVFLLIAKAVSGPGSDSTPNILPWLSPSPQATVEPQTPTGSSIATSGRVTLVVPGQCVDLCLVCGYTSASSPLLSSASKLARTLSSMAVTTSRSHCLHWIALGQPCMQHVSPAASGLVAYSGYWST